MQSNSASWHSGQHSRQLIAQCVHYLADRSVKAWGLVAVLFQTAADGHRCVVAGELSPAAPLLGGHCCAMHVCLPTWVCAHGASSFLLNSSACPLYSFVRHERFKFPCFRTPKCSFRTRRRRLIRDFEVFCVCRSQVFFLDCIDVSRCAADSQASALRAAFPICWELQESLATSRTRFL